MKTKLKYLVIASLLFGASGFNSAKAITADELLVAIQQYATAVNQAFSQIGQLFADHDSRISDNDARIAALEAEPKATIAATAPTAFDDINAGFTEGSIWIDTAKGVGYILLKNAPGAAVWKQISNDPNYYRIGDTGPAGGIVFYITDGGLHGLEAAPVDQGEAEWGCSGTNIPGADGAVVGTGAQNTADILDGCGSPGVAASLADAYTLNGFDDWFLPSIDELELIIQQKDVIGGFSDGHYWSSSEINDRDAFIVTSSTWFNPDLKSKTRLNWVRSVRTF